MRRIQNWIPAFAGMTVARLTHFLMLSRCCRQLSHRTLKNTAEKLNGTNFPRTALRRRGNDGGRAATYAQGVSMPSIETVERFIAMVEQSHTVEAMERYYAPSASMQENEHPPRTGLANLIAHERAALAQTRSVKAQCIRPVFVSDDRVVIRWVFEIEARDGQRSRLDELALQRWEGEAIVEEKFYYDPRQMRPADLTPDK
jgi:hypothetical protein